MKCRKSPYELRSIPQTAKPLDTFSKVQVCFSNFLLITYLYVIAPKNIPPDIQMIRNIGKEPNAIGLSRMPLIIIVIKAKQGPQAPPHIRRSTSIFRS